MYQSQPNSQMATKKKTTKKPAATKKSEVVAGPDQHLAQAQAQLEAMQEADPSRNVAKALEKISQALYWLGQDAAREA